MSIVENNPFPEPAPYSRGELNAWINTWKYEVTGGKPNQYAFPKFDVPEGQIVFLSSKFAGGEESNIHHCYFIPTDGEPRAAVLKVIDNQRWATMEEYELHGLINNSSGLNWSVTPEVYYVGEAYVPGHNRSCPIAVLDRYETDLQQVLDSPQELTNYLYLDGKLNIKNFLKVILTVLAGLDGLTQVPTDHRPEKLISHKDVKPANILLNTQGNPALTDFGLSLASVTEGRVAGTIQYMPKLALMAEPAYLRDLYSLASIMAAMIFGYNVVEDTSNFRQFYAAILDEIFGFADQCQTGETRQLNASIKVWCTDSQVIVYKSDDAYFIIDKSIDRTLLEYRQYWQTRLMDLIGIPDELLCSDFIRNSFANPELIREFFMTWIVQNHGKLEVDTDHSYAEAMREKIAEFRRDVFAAFSQNRIVYKEV